MCFPWRGILLEAGGNICGYNFPRAGTQQGTNTSTGLPSPQPHKIKGFHLEQILITHHKTHPISTDRADIGVAKFLRVPLWWIKTTLIWEQMPALALQKEGFRQVPAPQQASGSSFVFYNLPVPVLVAGGGPQLCDTEPWFF